MLPSIYGCSEQQGSSPPPPVPASAPSIKAVYWTQNSISNNSEWGRFDDKGNPENPMYSVNSATGLKIADTTIEMRFEIDSTQYSVGNSITAFKVRITGDEKGGGSFPYFAGEKGQKLKELDLTLTPLSLPAPTGKFYIFDLLSIVNSSGKQNITIDFENPDEIGAFTIEVQLQIMGDNGINGNEENYLFEPYIPPEYARICGPTTNIPQITMTLFSEEMESVGYPRSYTAIFEGGEEGESTPFVPDVPIRWVNPEDGFCMTGEDARYQVRLSFNFGKTIPANMVQPVGDETNEIQEFKMTINQIEGGQNNPIWNPTLDPPPTSSNTVLTIDTLSAPFTSIDYPISESPPQPSVNELFGFEDGLLTFGTMAGTVNTSTASITFTGTLLCDAYGKEIELEELGIVIPVSNFVALCGNP